MNESPHSLSLPPLRGGGSGSHDIGSTDDMSWQYSGADPADVISARAVLTFLDGKRPAWFADALCREHPDLEFVSRSVPMQAKCVQVCGRCSVREECRDYADDTADTFAVLGGEDPAARRARWRVRGRKGAA